MACSSCDSSSSSSWITAPVSWVNKLLTSPLGNEYGGTVAPGMPGTVAPGTDSASGFATQETGICKRCFSFWLLLLAVVLTYLIARRRD
jgi:hypothetical protein